MYCIFYVSEFELGMKFAIHENTICSNLKTFSCFSFFIYYDIALELKMKTELF